MSPSVMVRAYKVIAFPDVYAEGLVGRHWEVLD